VGRDDFDEANRQPNKLTYNMAIGEQMAERIRSISARRPR